MLRLLRPLSHLKSPVHIQIARPNHIAPVNHFLFRNMASETPAAGTHKDPVTGEMISKQFVRLSFSVIVFSHVDRWFLFFFACEGSSSAVKSSALRRPQRPTRPPHQLLHQPSQRRRALQRPISTQMCVFHISDIVDFMNLHCTLAIL